MTRKTIHVQDATQALKLLVAFWLDSKGGKRSFSRAVQMQPHENLIGTLALAGVA
jgi:hypothetical protein